MATLVLSTVGTVLGGPVGGAIGALLGQSIDQELLAPASRGPRLGDLSVQSSSYGTQVPRIYGSMRVAGSVIWATDLSESTATTGAKGQPDAVYSYSVSLAVGLSSRRIQSIKRIWADGKLLRGEGGDFKVSTTFRSYDGSDDQPVDPLIASIEGIASTPAYRGLALAVFEGLELAEFGNRIPFLTFEIVADAQPLTVGDILADASGGAIAADNAQSILGYAAYGASVARAVKPLVDCMGVDLFDDGAQLRSAQTGPIAISDSELGNAADGEPAAKIEREQAPARDVPASLRLNYYDSKLDYQSGDARATAGELIGNEEEMELPAVLDAATAKSLVQQMIARLWADRDKVTLRLPPAYLALEPGTTLELPISPRLWVVETVMIEFFVAVLQLRPARTTIGMLAADPGRIVANPDVVPEDIVLALLDTPAALSSGNGPSLTLAASTATPGWRSWAVEISVGDQGSLIRTAARKSKLGRALTALPPDQAEETSIVVEMVDPSQWLVSCDEAALAWGANTAILGKEVVQFADAIPIGPGQFELSGILRARDGTEWAMEQHSAGEWFLLIESDTLRVIELPSWSVGSEAVVNTVGAAPGSSPAQAIVGPGALSPLLGSALLLEGLQVVGARRSAIPWPAGGATVDSEARTALEEVLNALREHGLIEM